MTGLSLVVAFSTSLILKIVGWNLGCTRHLHSISLHLALVVTQICQQTSASPPSPLSVLCSLKMDLAMFRQVLIIFDKAIA